MSYDHLCFPVEQSTIGVVTQSTTGAVRQSTVSVVRQSNIGVVRYSNIGVVTQSTIGAVTQSTISVVTHPVTIVFLAQMFQMCSDRRQILHLVLSWAKKLNDWTLGQALTKPVQFIVCHCLLQIRKDLHLRYFLTFQFSVKTNIYLSIPQDY